MLKAGATLAQYDYFYVPNKPQTAVQGKILQLSSEESFKKPHSQQNWIIWFTSGVNKNRNQDAIIWTCFKLSPWERITCTIYSKVWWIKTFQHCRKKLVSV